MSVRMLLVGALLLLAASSSARADEQVYYPWPGDFEVTVRCSLTGPAANATFHTGGAGSMNITYSSTHYGKIVAYGTATYDTSWVVAGVLDLDSSNLASD